MPQSDKIEPILNYTERGFDKYLRKSIIPTIAGGTGGGGSSREMNFDQVQTTGSLGSKIKVGNIIIDGVERRILVNDGENDVVLLGFDSEGF